ncbi:MAG: glutamyl-tRNA reductase [Dehalococcoidia bacterium]|nr:glutamyl-tRNA reductase [Dehalococcoidia bacterium]HRC61802.1 glutamyl-tRNA reductase [Dehalococcoidia bacterium]
MLTLVGLSHQTAALEVREQLAIPADELPATLGALRERFGAGAILATCNRLELYLPGDHAREDVLAFLSDQAGLDVSLAAAHFAALHDRDAVRHLYSVAGGIDSMVLGESEVLGQVRAAFSASVAAGCDDALLSRLFHTAIRLGRRARTETAIGRHALSVSSISVQQARLLCPELPEATVLVIGAGEAGRLAAAALVEQGVRDVLVANRTRERAEDLAAELGGVACSLDELDEALPRADVVIAAADAPSPLVTRAMVDAAMEQRRRRPLLLVDIGVPRDIDHTVGELPGVTYYDLDGLQAIAAEHYAVRAGEVATVQTMVDEETDRFVEWWEQLQVVPTIAALTDRAERLRSTELAKTLRRLNVGDEERAHLEALTRALVKQILHDPIATLRERGDREVYIDAVRKLFRLDDEPGDLENRELS